MNLVRVCKVLVAQLGARRHYAVPRALYQSGLLERLVTDACVEIPPWRWLDKILPTHQRPDVLRRLLGRRVPDVPAVLIKGYPLFAMSASLDRRKGETQTDCWARRNADFCRKVLRTGFGESNIVYAFNGAALEIFQVAKERGVRTILDQTAAPWRWNSKLLREESDRWPGWEAHPAEIDITGTLSDREEAEWSLADRIICGSQFAAEALAAEGGPSGRTAIVPYGVHLTRDKTYREVRGRGQRGELRVLFVGTLQLRKGVQYLWEASRLLKKENMVFRLVGPSLLSEKVMKVLRSEMEITGAVPRSEIKKHYAWADLFVLPTLSEGSANVIYEAMAAGLPVITTLNAGSIIRNGENGLLVPIRDTEALVKAILEVANNGDLKNKFVFSALHSLQALGIGGGYAERLKREVVGNWP